MSGKSHRWSKISEHGDLLFATLVVAVISLLIVPLPTPLLDVLLTANIAFAVVLLLTAIYVRTPLQFSTFPSVLLVATLFRLALNVSSTRLILGEAYAGEVIESFGDFVVRGNYVVGAVVFLILTVIQFLVIAKGSERVAEVAARFTLDAMPGKQMAIDADLRAGAFTLPEARRRRVALQRESQLFGAMDGAMKFVKGDAIAGIIITITNVVGGLIIGVAQRGMGAAEAAETYTLLTIGDGLVSQIPALVVSLAAGLIVTRVGGDTDKDLGTEIVSQLGATPKVFGIAALLLVALGLVPGLPLVPFLVLAIGAALASRASLTAQRRRERDAAERSVVSQPADTQENIMVPAVTPVLLELGAELAAVLKAKDGDEAMRTELRVLRDAFFTRLGVKLPAVRVRFGVPKLAANAVRVSVYEVPEFSAAIPLDQALVNAPPAVLKAQGFEATLTLHPLTKAAMSLVPEVSRAALSAAGLPVLTVAEHVMLFVGAAAHTRAERFIGLAEVQAALDQLEPSHGALIDAVTPRPVSLARLTGVFKRLVGEGVSIRDFRAVLEALAEDANEDLDVIELTELARVGLSRRIMSAVAPSGDLKALLVDHGIEQAIRDSIRRDSNGRPSLSLPPRMTSEIIEAFRGYLGAGQRTTVVTSQDVRRYLRQLLALEYGPLVVVGLRELHEGVRLETVAEVRVGG